MAPDSQVVNPRSRSRRAHRDQQTSSFPCVKFREQLVRQDDADFFMHIVPDEIGALVADFMRSLSTDLADLDLGVSTGRVVDFRATDFLRANPEVKTVPLIYPRNFENGYIEWPRLGKKPQAMAVLPGVESLLVPAGVYVFGEAVLIKGREQARSRRHLRSEENQCWNRSALRTIPTTTTATVTASR